jgi:hypothetical protein
VTGFVQFDPNERDANGQEVRDIVVQQAGGEGVNIRVTVWPEFADTELSKGDFVAVSGKLTKNVSKGKTYLNLSARDLVVIPAVAADRSGSEVDGALDEDDDLAF